MTSTQTLIIDRITTEIESRHNLVVTNDREYANTGTLRTMHADSLAEVASARYDFQQNSARFGRLVDPIASIDYGRPRRDGMKDYVVSTVPELIDRVVAHLTGGAA